MRSLGKIEYRETEYVYRHIRVAQLLFRSSHRDQMPQVAFRAKVASVMDDVHPCLCASSISVDFLQCHFGKEGSHPFHFRKPLPAVFWLQPSPCSSQETQHRASSLLWLLREGSGLVVTYPLLQHVKTLLWLVGRIQGKTHVELFKLYPTSLSCHSNWHVENLQDISFCF
jgi:hypothetical protein